MRAIGCDHGGRYGSLIGGVHAPAPAMGKAAKAHQRCDIHIPVNIGSLGEQPDHSRPLPPDKHGEGATPQLYLPATGGTQPGKAAKQTAFPCSICPQDHCNMPLTKGPATSPAKGRGGKGE